MAKIRDISVYLPDKIETNELLEKENPGWDLSKVIKRIGIKQRHIAGDDETSLDMAQQACEDLFKSYDRNKIDFVILCTQSPDYLLPTTACLLQDRLSLRENVGAFDFNLGCSGYIYGLAIAKGLINGGMARNVLFVTSETYSKYIHPQDRSNRSIFGDAATATIIESTEVEQIYDFVFGTRGSGYDRLIVKNGGLRYPTIINCEEWEYGSGNITSDNHLYMDGPAIYNFSHEVVPAMVDELLKKSSLKLDDIDYFIYHQANKFMMDQIRKKQGIEPDKFHFNIENTGNTVSSTIPISLKDAIDTKVICAGNQVLLAGFGVGLSWGATILTI